MGERDAGREREDGGEEQELVSDPVPPSPPPPHPTQHNSPTEKEDGEGKRRSQQVRARPRRISRTPSGPAATREPAGPPAEPAAQPSRSH